MDLAELFAEEDYRFHMRFQRGIPNEFFAHTMEHERLVAERRRWLQTNPRDYSALLIGGIPLLDETIEALREWQVLADADAREIEPIGSPQERCIALGRILEPDFLLLSLDANGGAGLAGGCVCFPSSWALAEKIGRPIESIHGPVPDLNEQIGKAIRAFLVKLAPGAAWFRQNWGLCRTAELNQHPLRVLPRLDKSVRLDEVWLRVEHQALIALPKSRGVLFGIRIAMHPLSEVASSAPAARKLRRALETMPDEMAAYKGLGRAREAIARMLAA